MKILLFGFGILRCSAIFKKWKGQGVICQVVWNFDSVYQLIPNFLTYRWELVGWSLNGLLLFKQLGFVWHSVALIFSVISCSLYSCIYVITILNSFRRPSFYFPPFPLTFLSSSFFSFPYLSHWFSSCLIFFLSPSLLHLNSSFLQPPPPYSLFRSVSS